MMSKNSQINYSNMHSRSRGPSNLTSAEIIVPKLIKWIHPGSVIDIGCATGVWLEQFKRYSPNEVKIHGVDGDWVREHRHYIDDKEITYYDFESDTEFPIHGKYDLAVCLEMAEHLSAEKADKLIDILINLSDVIYFSAATPNSGGMHHVNERWQSYWWMKFRKRNYVLVDRIRHEVWNNKKVCYFYSQESFIYVNAEKLENYPELMRYCLGIGGEYSALPIDVIHPELFMNQVIKPSHDWEYLFNIYKRVVHSMFLKAMHGIKMKANFL